MKGVDNMNIYMDSANDIDLIAAQTGQEMTPYHRLIMVNDFSQILGQIETGMIPTATGKPFPVDPVSEYEDFSNPFGGEAGKMFRQM